MSSFCPPSLDEERRKLEEKTAKYGFNQSTFLNAVEEEKALAGNKPLREQQDKRISLKENRRLRWEEMARPSQRIPPGNWVVWLILAGRGFGKTRTGAETILAWVRHKKCRLVALVAETEDEVRRVMVEGESGILTVSPNDERPQYTICKGELLWPCGAKAMIYTAENYDKLRGGQFDGAWVDELAKFRNAQKVWDQLMFGLRLGEHPQVVVTTTPRPLSFLEQLMNDPTTHLTKGSTYENADNLSPLFINQILRAYEGTRLGAQEIYAELLFDRPGALWTRDLIVYGLPRLKGDSSLKK